MTSKEIVKRAICFENPPRLPHEFPEKFGSDFAWAYTSPPLDDRPRGQSATDEWGAVWQNLGLTEVGEVKDFPLKDWADFDKLTVPDFKNPRRWRELKGVRAQAGDKFLIAGGVSLYERVHFIRGLQNT